MIRLILFLLIMAFISAGWAQSVSGPININADSMQYYGNTFRSTFTGNVNASSDNFTLTSDRVDVYFNDKNEVQRIVCDGQVVFKSNDILATANKAELMQPTKMITLEGNAEIWQKENYLRGEKVRMQYETKEIQVEKGSGSRIEVIFKPDDNTSLP